MSAEGQYVSPIERLKTEGIQRAYESFDFETAELVRLVGKACRITNNTELRMTTDSMLKSLMLEDEDDIPVLESSLLN